MASILEENVYTLESAEYYMGQISKYLESIGGTARKRGMIRDAVGDNQNVTIALDRLCDEGYTIEDDGGNGRRIVTLITPYCEEEDPPRAWRIASDVKPRVRRERNEYEIKRRWQRRKDKREFVSYFSRCVFDPCDSVHLDHLIRLSSLCHPWELCEEIRCETGYNFIPLLIGELVRVIKLKEMEYSLFLKTKEWGEVADRAKMSYGGRCAFDAKHPAEEAHHRTYERRGRELPEDVIPLCGNCHARHHGRDR